jgi:hypothetical protein
MTKKPSRVGLMIGDRRVWVPVSDELQADFRNRFKSRTDDQKDRRNTLFRLMRAAYRAGGKAASQTA